MIIKTLVLSKLIYLLTNIPSPHDQCLKEPNTIIFSFLWKGGRDKVRREIIVKSREEGGIGMVDLATFNKALKLTWTKRLLMSDSEAWKSIISYSVDCEMIIYTGGYISPEIITSIVNPFWKEVFTCWNELVQKMYSPSDPVEIYNHPLWNNVNSSVKCCCVELGYQAGMKSVRDIVDNHGGFKSFQEVKQKYSTCDNFLSYNKLLYIIPKSWQTKIKNIELD